jgi:YbbR domain-containing protein
MIFFDKERMRDFIRDKDVIPKVVCVFLASILWCNVRDKQTDVNTYTIPIEPVNLSSQNVISDMPRRNVTVSISGNKDDLKNLSRQSLTAEVDLRNPVLGKMAKYDVQFSIAGNKDIFKYELSDKRVFIMVERIVNRRVPVRLDLNSGKNRDTIVVRAKVQPLLMDISGPESLITGITEIPTESYTSPDRRGEINTSIRLVNPDPDRVALASDSVSLNLLVISADEVDRVTVPITIRGENPLLSYELSSGSVTLFIRHVEGRTIDDDDIAAFIDVTGYMLRADEASMQQEFPVRVNTLRRDVQFVSFMPDIIRVAVKRR